MYINGFVVAVKINGKTVEEKDNKIILPFDTEYSLMLKNRNSRRAVARVYVDGEEVTKTGALIVNANSSLNLERFVDNDDKGNRFKFVSLSNEKVQDKKDSEKGFIEVRFRLEKVVETPVVIRKIIEEHHYDHYHYPYYPYHKPYLYGNVFYCSSDSGKNLSLGGMNSNLDITSSSTDNKQVSFNFCSSIEKGATIKGSESDQKFTYAYVGELESTETVIRFELLGTNDIRVVDEYIKKHCEKCGKKYESKDKFCSECGEKR